MRIIDAGKKLAGTGTAMVSEARSFQGSVKANAILAKSKLNTIAEEVIVLLDSDHNATIWFTPDIAADFPNGASDTIKLQTRQ